MPSVYLVLAIFSIIPAFGFEISNFQRTPSEDLITYNTSLPLIQFQYIVPSDVYGCKHTYGTGEVNICLTNEQCNANKGFFATQANDGENTIIIDCWNKDGVHSIIENKFIVKSVNAGSAAAAIKARDQNQSTKSARIVDGQNADVVSISGQNTESSMVDLTGGSSSISGFFIKFIIAVLIGSGILLWLSKLFSFEDPLYTYALFESTAFSIVFFGTQSIFSLTSSLMVTFIAGIALIEFGYDNTRWMTSIFASAMMAGSFLAMDYLSGLFFLL